MVDAPLDTMVTLTVPLRVALGIGLAMVITDNDDMREEGVEESLIRSAQDGFDEISAILDAFLGEDWAKELAPGPNLPAFLTAIRGDNERSK